MKWKEEYEAALQRFREKSKELAEAIIEEKKLIMQLQDRENKALAYVVSAVDANGKRKFVNDSQRKVAYNEYLKKDKEYQQLKEERLKLSERKHLLIADIEYLKEYMNFCRTMLTVEGGNHV